MYNSYLFPSNWERGNSYAKYAIVTDGKFRYVAKNDIQISLIPPKEDRENWINESKNSSVIVDELEAKIKKWKLNKEYSEFISELESILYE